MRAPVAAISAVLFLTLCATHVGAEPFRCELYADEMERVPCYNARAAHFAAKETAAYRLYRRHSAWKHYPARRHAMHAAR
jgi:hypothetical protein